MEHYCSLALKLFNKNTCVWEERVFSLSGWRKDPHPWGGWMHVLWDSTLKLLQIPREILLRDVHVWGACSSPMPHEDRIHFPAPSRHVELLDVTLHVQACVYRNTCRKIILKRRIHGYNAIRLLAWIDCAQVWGSWSPLMILSMFIHHRFPHVRFLVRARKRGVPQERWSTRDSFVRAKETSLSCGEDKILN